MQSKISFKINSCGTIGRGVEPLLLWKLRRMGRQTHFPLSCIFLSPMQKKKKKVKLLKIMWEIIGEEKHIGK